MGVGINIIFKALASEEWPRPGFDPNKPRPESLFKTGWNDTLKKLKYELGRRDVFAVVIKCGFTERNIRVDGWYRARAEPEHPGVIVEYQTPEGWERIARDKYVNWRHNVHTVARTLEALRDIDRWGEGGGEQYEGYKIEIEAPVTSANAAGELLESYGGLREALKATHPDRGGDPGEFRRVQEAREALGL